MRLANLAGRAALVVGDDHYVDIAKASDGRFGPELQVIYEQWDAFIEHAPALIKSGEVAAADKALLGAPSPMPRQVFAVGTNYCSHSDETGTKLPKKPATFTKYPTCITGPYAPVHLPPRGMVDWEIELVAIIGRRAERIPEADAWGYIAGLTVGQDLSERWLQIAAGRQFALGKSYPGFGPTGPWLVTVDEFADPGDLALGCDVDGESMQDGRTSAMIFSVPSIIAELSAVVPLLPGDVIFTGTPGGVGGARTPPRFLQAGQVLNSWVEGIGSLRNEILPPA